MSVTLTLGGTWLFWHVWFAAFQHSGVCVYSINDKSDSPGSAVWGGRWGLPVLSSSPNCLTTGSSDHRVMTAYDCQNTCHWLAAPALACAEAQFSLSFFILSSPSLLSPPSMGLVNTSQMWKKKHTQVGINSVCVCGRSRTRCHVFWLVCVCLRVWGDRKQHGDMSALE